jgi:hypothetical protein
MHFGSVDTAKCIYTYAHDKMNTTFSVSAALREYGC